MKNVCIEHDNQTHFDAILNKKRIKTREISNNIDNMKSAKVPGTDGVSAAMLQARDVIIEVGNPYRGIRNIWCLGDSGWSTNCQRKETQASAKNQRHHTTDRKSFQQGDLKQNNYGPKLRIKQARFRNEDNVEP